MTSPQVRVEPAACLSACQMHGTFLYSTALCRGVLSCEPECQHVLALSRGQVLSSVWSHRRKCLRLLPA
jgi:hypothetical protein